MYQIWTCNAWVHRKIGSAIKIICCAALYVCLFVCVCIAKMCIHHQTLTLSYTDTRMHAHTHRAPVNFDEMREIEIHTHTSAGVSVLMDALNDDLQNESIAWSIIHTTHTMCECNCEWVYIPFVRILAKNEQRWLKLTVSCCSNSWWSDQKKIHQQQ